MSRTIVIGWGWMFDSVCSSPDSPDRSNVHSSLIHSRSPLPGSSACPDHDYSDHNLWHLFSNCLYQGTHLTIRAILIGATFLLLSFPFKSAMNKIFMVVGVPIEFYPAYFMFCKPKHEKPGSTPMNHNVTIIHDYVCRIFLISDEILRGNDAVIHIPASLASPQNRLTSKPQKN